MTCGPLVGCRPVRATATSLARAHALATQLYSHAQPHGCSHHVPWPLCMRVPALVALPMAPEAPPVLCGRPAAARACPCGVSRLLGPLGDLISAFPAPLTVRISDHPPPECSGMILGCLGTFSSVWRALGSMSAACDWHSLHLIATCALTGTPRNLLECIPRSVVLLESIPSIVILSGSEVPRICDVARRRRPIE